MILELPQEKQESYRLLRDLQDIPRMALQQVGALGEPVTEWGFLLMQIILSRAPYGLVRAWERDRNHEDEPAITDFFDWLDRRARSP